MQEQFKVYLQKVNAKVQKANAQKIRAKTRFSKNTGDTEDPYLGTQTQAEQKHRSKAEQEFRKAHS